MALPNYIDRLDISRAWSGSSLDGVDPANAVEFDRAFLQHLRGRETPRFYFDEQKAGDIGEAIMAQKPAQARWVIDRADCALAHRLPAADEEHSPYDVEVGDPIDWYGNTSIEPQSVFTINRHRFWPELAMAYRFTGDSRYIEELQKQIVSWCEQSPPLADLDDWKSFPQCWWLLDAAVRADTWLWTLFLAISSPNWKPEVNTLFIHRLWVHARFLRHNTPRTGTYWAPNWLIMQAQGLLGIAVMFPEFVESAEWSEHAITVLNLCAEAQFYADGGHCEQSPIYHEYCLRWLAEPFYLARINGAAGTDNSWAIIERASEFVYQITMPDGTLPNLSDGGRTSGGILTQMGLLFNRPEWMRYRDVSARDCWFLGGVPDNAAIAPPPRPLAVAYKETGYYVLRSGDAADDIQMIFDCGTTGGGHGHFDLLGFDLYGFRTPLVPDPGRLIYDDSPDRHWLLGTPSHNTISLDGQNHARIERDESSRIHFAEWRVDADAIVVSGWHEGYTFLDGAPLVGRAIWFDRIGLFVVVDWIRSTAEHEATVSFNVPGVDAALSPSGGLNATVSHGNISVQPLLLDGQHAVAAAAFHSPDYGIREPAVRLVISQRGQQMVFVTVLAAASEQPPACTAKLAGFDEQTGTIHIALPIAGNARTITLTAPFTWQDHSQSA